MRDEAPEGIEQSVYRSLTGIFLQLDDYDRRFFAEHGLSTRQFWALQHLDEQIGRSMVELSRLLFTDKSNVTGIVDRLEAAGLVARTPAPHDRRVILITLTPEGRRQRDFVHAQHITRIRDVLGSIGEGHLHTLLDLLSPISRNLEIQLARASGAPARVPDVGMNGR